MIRRLADEYGSSTIAELATQVGVSAATVRRALVRHGIDRLPRNRNRRPVTAQVLDDPDWLRERYRTHTGVEIAAEIGVAAHTVYPATGCHSLSSTPRSRRLSVGQLCLTHDVRTERKSIGKSLAQLDPVP